MSDKDRIRDRERDREGKKTSENDRHRTPSPDPAQKRHKCDERSEKDMRRDAAAVVSDFVDGIVKEQKLGFNRPLPAEPNKILISQRFSGFDGRRIGGFFWRCSCFAISWEFGLRRFLGFFVVRPSSSKHVALYQRLLLKFKKFQRY